MTLDFRMSTTCLYSDIVLPDGHLVREERPQHQRHAPFHPPAVAAVDPAWQARSDWEIFYKASPEKFSEVCVGHLGVEKELVLTPLMHDSPGELGSP